SATTAEERQRHPPVHASRGKADGQEGEGARVGVERAAAGLVGLMPPPWLCPGLRLTDHGCPELLRYPARCVSARRTARRTASPAPGGFSPRPIVQGR